MDMILHIGAHRTATTSFQHYLRQNAQDLIRQGLWAWEPKATRDGLFEGVIHYGGQATKQTQLREARQRLDDFIQTAPEGVKNILVSEENLMGTPRRNVLGASLYPNVAASLTHAAAAFDGRVRRVALTIRSLESYWRSLVTYFSYRFGRMPEPAVIERIAAPTRRWREVIVDLAGALPGVEILVFPFEAAAGRSRAFLRALTGIGDPPRRAAGAHRNALPAASDRRAQDPSWPFDPAAERRLQGLYQDDLRWLRDGADGAARFIERIAPNIAAKGPQPG